MDDFTVTDEDFEFTDQELQIAVDVIEQSLYEEEEAELDEVLSVAQRRKASRAAKRGSSRRAAKAKRTRRKKAGPERIKLRAKRTAKRMMRKRVAGKSGSKYSELSSSQKVKIDQQLEKRKDKIERMAKRLEPKIKKKERERVKNRRSNLEQYEDDMRKRQSINEAFDAFYEKVDRHDKKIRTALRERAREHEVPISVVREVYNRGVRDFQENGKKTFTESQWAFHRVDSFLNGGKARQIDEDLWSKVSKLNTIIEKLS